MMQQQTMDITKEGILSWLNQHHHTREWLAEQCQVSRRTVDNWLVSPRPIPNKAKPIIASLMKADEDRERMTAFTPQNLVLQFSRDDFETICKASKEKGPVKWAEDTLREIAQEDMDQLQRRLEAAEDQATYSKKANHDVSKSG